MPSLGHGLAGLLVNPPLPLSTCPAYFIFLLITSSTKRYLKSYHFSSCPSSLSSVSCCVSFCSIKSEKHSLSSAYLLFQVHLLHPYLILKTDKNSVFSSLY